MVQEKDNSSEGISVAELLQQSKKVQDELMEKVKKLELNVDLIM